MVDAAGLDVMFSARWPTLGRAVHYWHHADYPAGFGPGRLPDPPTSSIISPSGTPAREQPPGALVDAIDRRWGRYELDERLSAALAELRLYDAIMASVVHVLCIAGRVQLIPGSRVRHYSHEGIVGEAPFEGDVRKLGDWLALAWELLGVLIAPQDSLEEAIRKGAAAQWAVRWASERGML